MLEYIAERKLANGKTARVARIVPPEADGLRGLYCVSPEWNLYYNRAMSPGHSEYIEDRLFIAEIDGAPLARLWYAWSKRTFHGNYGNIYTNPAHRQQGLLNFLLDCFKPDFDASPAQMLCCSASGYRIPVYEKYGFKVLHGNREHDAMGILKPELGSFDEYTARLYADKSVAKVRAGNPGDQFDCDKCLVYTREMWGAPVIKASIFAGDDIGSFQTVINRVLAGHGTCSVAENAGGSILGYASALYNGSGTAAFVTLCKHPSMNVDEAGKLVSDAVASYRGSFDRPLFAAIFSGDAFCMELFTGMGGQVKARLSAPEVSLIEL